MTRISDRRRRFSRQEWALAAITAVWGSTFLTVHKALAVTGPWSFVALRFGFAAVVLAALSWTALRGLTRRELGVGALIGVSLCGGYGLQTIGLETVSSSMSAFLTALYVPLVPLGQWALSRRAPGAGAWAGIACAFCGLLLLTGVTATGLQWGTGETATLLGTVAIAVEILLIGRFAGTVDARRVTVVQLAVCSLLAAVARPLSGEDLPAPSWTLGLTVVALGLATAVIQVVMNWAQRTVSATHATVIYAAEPVWAALLGRLAGERLGLSSLGGGVLIVVAVLVSELGGRQAPPSSPQQPAEQAGRRAVSRAG
ncbi:DMT family transporter [Actinoplanes sp. URMC 104]|uniref:DMT family transporter n=1 Tax=Actinoplanes sp. URMC 104 TaxID=3423409 RepID=UPI003F19B403